MAVGYHVFGVPFILLPIETDKQLTAESVRDASDVWYRRRWGIRDFNFFSVGEIPVQRQLHKATRRRHSQCVPVVAVVFRLRGSGEVFADKPGVSCGNTEQG